MLMTRTSSKTEQYQRTASSALPWTSPQNIRNGTKASMAATMPNLPSGRQASGYLSRASVEAGLAGGQVFDAVAGVVGAVVPGTQQHAVRDAGAGKVPR